MLKESFFKIFDRVGSVSVAAREAGENPGARFGLGRSWARVSLDASSASASASCRVRTASHAGGCPATRGEEQVGINLRTAKDWDRGVRKTRGARTYRDGPRVGYNTGVTPMAASLTALERELHPRFLSLVERETIADMHRAGWSLHAIGRALGRAASTIKREIDNHAGADGVYRAHAAHRAWVGPGPGPSNASCCRTDRCASSWPMGCANGGRRGRSATL